ncbi:MAG: 50S ribosomal protein L32, partial [Actinomycetota bacterium]|nr:50S ribosomal protein L32 [Actinomycetota bacterium]
AHHALKSLHLVRCPNCGEPSLSHRVCPECGNYKGRTIIAVGASE